VNLREGEESLDLRVIGRFAKKTVAYREAGHRLRVMTARYPNAPVIWTSISPQPFGHFRDLLTILPAFRPDQQVFAVVHWGRFEQLFRSPLTRWTAGRLMDRLAGIIFLNENRALQCAPWIPTSRQFVIANTLDSPVVCTHDEVDRKQRAYDGKRPMRLLFLSHMLHEKGYFDVLEAVNEVRQRGLHVEATFAGQWLSDDDRQAFTRYVSAHRLQDIVTHRGPVEDRARIKVLHLAADLFLLPSYLIEGQPLTIIEAMNAGSPVVTTRIGGMVDMIQHKVEGEFVPSKDPGAIAEAIMRLRDLTTWQNASKAARIRYLRTYSAPAVLEKWKRLLERG
jgi:glycosyltransferase involved in cell wall biosynthesis